MDFLETISKIEYRENEEMSRHTTFKIGGAAKYFIIPKDREELIKVLKAVRLCGIRYTVLGRGSNVLFSDGGYDGAVITTEKLTAVSVSGNSITCEAGASFTQCAATARDNSLAGLEFAYGIPGFVGGAVFMNAGAYGGEVSQVLKRSTYYDIEKDETVTIDISEHEFGYRESVYRKHPEWVILSAEFQLPSGNFDEIKEKMDSHMEARRTKQPLEYPSAGSVFKRCQGHYTGQMIEELGLKGFRIGGAEISEKHAGFIVNRGCATAEDVMNLVDFIKEKVKEGFGCDLECELISIK